MVSAVHAVHVWLAMHACDMWPGGQIEKLQQNATLSIHLQSSLIVQETTWLAIYSQSGISCYSVFWLFRDSSLMLRRRMVSCCSERPLRLLHAMGNTSLLMQTSPRTRYMPSNILPGHSVPWPSNYKEQCWPDRFMCIILNSVLSRSRAFLCVS